MQITRYVFLLLLLQVKVVPCFSQGEIDSLMAQLNQTETAVEKVNLWNEISNHQQPIGGKEAAENALELAQSIKYPEGEADANYYLGSYYYLKDNQNLAKVHMLKALALYDHLNLRSAKVQTLNFLGEIIYFDKEYTTALKYLQEAENIAIQIKDEELLAQVFETKALIYIDGLVDIASAKSYLLKSNDLLVKTKSLNLLVHNYSNLAAFYVENNILDSSLLFIKKGEVMLSKLEDARSNNSIYLQHSFTSLKGTCYAKAGKVDTAKLFIKQSLPFFIENENWYDVAWCYTDLSLVALKEEKYKVAINYAKQSIELDITNASLEANTKLIRDAFRHLDQDSFHIYNEKYISILNDVKKNININEIQTVIKEEELSKKEKELIDKKNGGHKIILGVLLLAIVYTVNLLLYYRGENEKKISANLRGKNKSAAIPKNKEVEIDKLRQKVNTIERSLLSKEIDLERQRSSIDNTTQHLKELVAKNNPIELKRSLQKLSLQLAHNQNDKQHWAFFFQQFEQVHPDFFNQLRGHTSNLSTREMRLCAYSRLGMTNQEVGQVLGIATSSVNKARHRLKKKMNLEKEQDLNQFLVGL